jgi:glycerophosphoryl diester phosphodiesterase
MTKRALPSEQGRPLVIGHRGAKAYLPENTLPAYALALEQGADMLEIDLHRSSDGEIPIRHDEGLEALGCDGGVGELSLTELRRLSDRDGAEAAAEDALYPGIPTLEQVLDAFGAQVPFNLEIKTRGSGAAYAGLQAEALRHVVDRGLLGETLFSSFSDEVLDELRRLEPSARLGVLVHPRHPERIFERAEAVGAEAVNPHFLLATKELVADAHSHGLAVYVYTVDDEAQMRRLLDIGVDGIFSNCPDVLRSVVDSLAQK